MPELPGSAPPGVVADCILYNNVIDVVGVVMRGWPCWGEGGKAEKNEEVRKMKLPVKSVNENGLKRE